MRITLVGDQGATVFTFRCEHVPSKGSILVFGAREWLVEEVEFQLHGDIQGGIVECLHVQIDVTEIRS